MAQVELLPEVQKFLEGRPKMIIDGVQTDASSGETFDVIDPSTGRPFTAVPRGGAPDVDTAVAAARRAHEEGRWRGLRPGKRAEILFKIGELIKKKTPELAQIETLDSGKPLRTASGEIWSAGEAFRYYSGWPTKVFGETNPTDESMLVYTLREPVGVCGGITPWNYPMVMAAWKIAPALAFGNTIVLKPAEQTPLTAIRLAEICLEAGVPEGVVNVVTGFGPEAGAALAEHEDVDKIAFTGSTEVGKIILKASAGNLKRVTLELGGKSPNIVFPDADMRRAAKGSMLGVFVNAGQTCTAGTRILVERSIHDEFVSAMVEATKAMKLGPGLDEQSAIGPVVSQEQLERVTGYIDVGRSEGAELVHGGERATELGDGYFVQPTIFTGVRNDMRIAREEIFGPVAAVIEVDDADHAIEVANDTMYGLAAAVWTRDISTAHKVARGIKAGTVWVNTAGLYDPATSFGGYKQSGFGRELGLHSVETYTQTKSVWVSLK
ncbi:MAG TPA: aldehyde dehydrogenase family protein [Actinomycetota bacterium]|jgi:acyl-CoA reductase-like NAD-dependent aldehyde dehydrogenase|nr:aldehyde dehydrogenase family protein [Actinomycetota bacterium]